MPKQPLDVLLQVRQMAVDQAKQALAECVAGETTASMRRGEIQAAIFRETDAARSLTADDQAVEAFANWLRATLPAQRAADQAVIEAEARTEEARIVLAAARAGVRVIENTLEHRATERQTLDMRAEQRTLDEAARALPR